MITKPIGIFDSGSGGLTVLDSLRNLMPCENYVYVSDSMRGGWGSLTEKQICARAFACVNKLREYGCKLIVAGCNTATAVAIDDIRKDFDIPVVGLEPALKPAAEAFPDGNILVLCTPATARQPKFKSLLAEYGAAKFAVRPQPMLARKIEKNLHELESLRGEAESITSEREFSACVLGCTHYVFLRSIFEQLMGGADKVFDGNSGVARRAREILAAQNLLRESARMGEAVFDSV